jgi:hypothetical protein
MSYYPMPPSELSDVKAFLSTAPEVNSHLMTLIQRRSTNTDSLSIWIKKSPLLVGVAAYYESSMIIYEEPTYSKIHQDDLRFLIQYLKPTSIGGPKSLVESLNDLIDQSSLDITWVSVLMPKSPDYYLKSFSKESSIRLEAYSLSNLNEKITLQNSVFNLQIPLNHIGTKDLLVDGTLRGYVIRHHGIIVATGEWLDKHPQYGLILGVATDCAHRRKHYAQQIVIRLCLDIISHNKMPILRYNDPGAGKLYANLGFHDVAEFAFARLLATPPKKDD